MPKDAQVQEEDTYEQAKEKLQQHTEHLFRKAGEGPEAKRLRLSILSYRLASLQREKTDEGLKE